MLHPKPSGTHQPLPRQTGPQVSLNEPNESLWVCQDFQKDVAANLLTIPLSSISGTLLLRSGQCSIDHFNAEISDEFPYPRSIFVPIDLPSSYERAVRSAARRALGPMGDALERSGVSITMRSVGARKVRASAGATASAAVPLLPAKKKRTTIPCSPRIPMAEETRQPPSKRQTSRPCRSTP
jgi:hypothetical protein